MSHNPPFKSQTFTLIPGATQDFDTFVPIQGPNGGRVVVDHFDVRVVGTITVGTATWPGLDVPRLMSLITVTKRDGRVRWNLSGYKTRIASVHFNGIESHTDHADVTVGAGKAIDLTVIIPMTKPKLFRGEDFAQPGDTFQKITLNFAPLASAATNGAVLSANALQVYINAEWHEEMNLEFKCEDSVKSVDFTSATQGRLSLGGACQDILVVKEDNTANGASINAITDARIEELGTPVLTRSDLVNSYRAKNDLGACLGGATTGAERYIEPVTGGIALPVMASDDSTSSWDGKVLPQLKIDFTSGLAGVSAISREVLDKSQSDYGTLVALYKVDPRTIRMKTKGKTRRSLSDPGWTDRQKLVGCWSAPLRKAQ